MSPVSSRNGFLMSSNVANREYTIVFCSCQLVYFLRQCIVNYASLEISTVAIFVNNSRWRPDTMPVVISTKFNMKLGPIYHKVYGCQIACFCHQYIILRYGF